MKRIFLLASILVLSASWAVAQYSSTGTSEQSSAAANTKTVQGCLSGSEGSYSLTDQAGTTYKLTGDTAKLQAHVGHTIHVTGTPSSDMSSNGMGRQSGSMSESAESPQTLQVSSFKHISATCMQH